MRTRMPLLPVLLLGVVIGATVPIQAGDDVTIYRCTDADGRLSLQDTPCADGQRQEVRSMLRPQDPPARAEPATAAVVPAEAAIAEVVIRTPPRPMYECATPEGERYVSDSGDGNPRPAPVWGGWDGWDGGLRAGPVPGVPPGPRSTAERRAAGIASPGMSTSPGPSLTRPAQPQAPAPPPSRPRPPGHGYPGYGYGYSGGIIRDQCHQLPQAAVCGRLGDRRAEIRRRAFNAQPTERAALRGEERDITARLNDDCGIR